MTHFALLVTIRKVDKFFSLFGKIILGLVIIGLLAGGGYYLGKKYAVVPNTSSQPTATTIPTVTTRNNTPSTPTTSQQQDVHVAITAGGISPFAKYILSGFKDWTVTKENTDASDKLTLTKGEYQLVIDQSPSGGYRCTYPGDPSVDMSSPFISYVTIPSFTDDNFFRRGKPQQSPDPSKQEYIVCQKNSATTYGAPTIFGHITYSVPLNADNQTVVMMDAMVGSLQKQ